MTHVRPFGNNFFIILVVVFVNQEILAQKKSILSSKITDSISLELQRMASDDQKYRWTLMLGETEVTILDSLKKLEKTALFERITNVKNNKIGLTKAKKDSIQRLQDELDNLNFNSFLLLFNKYGYINNAIDKSNFVEILLRHNTKRLDSNLIMKLKNEVIIGNMEAKKFASLIDYKLENENKYVLYCITEKYNSTTKTFSLPKPMNLEITNKARKEIGLKEKKKRSLKNYEEQKIKFIE